VKRPFLVLMSIAATGGFGYWLVRTPNTQREILLACAGWVLGFWVAAAIQGRRRARDEMGDEAQYDDDFAADGEDAEADWDDEDEDWDESDTHG
jgi:hypothetical protein